MFPGYVERLQKVEDQIGKTGAFMTGPDFSVAESKLQMQTCNGNS